MASSMNHLSSLHNRVESGPSSESTKEDPTEEARFVAQSCHFVKSDRVAENVEGLRNSGIWRDFWAAGGEDRREDEEMGAQRLEQ